MLFLAELFRARAKTRNPKPEALPDPSASWKRVLKQVSRPVGTFGVGFSMSTCRRFLILGTLNPDRFKSLLC